MRFILFICEMKKANTIERIVYRTVSNEWTRIETVNLKLCIFSIRYYESWWKKKQTPIFIVSHWNFDDVVQLTFANIDDALHLIIIIIFLFYEEGKHTYTNKQGMGKKFSMQSVHFVYISEKACVLCMMLFFRGGLTLT